MATAPSRLAPKMRCFASAFLVTTFIIGAIAGPWPQHRETQCASTCTENKKFQYDVGTTYSYRYEGDIKSGMDMTKDDTRLRIRATVEIRPKSKCDFTMRLSDVTMGKNQLETVKGAQFSEALERHQMRFAFQDGRIGDLCPDASEPVWVLNIKRGILSAFQNTMDDLDKDQSQNEVDITGNCVTEYRTNRRERPGIIIHKTKDMANCSNRVDRYSSIQTSPAPAGFGGLASMPLIKSSHTCLQYVQHGILRESECTEEHVFQPFSRRDSGATTKNVQSLTFMSKQRTDVPTDGKADYVLARKSLLFDHNAKDQEQSDAQKAEARDALKELCRAASDEVTPEVPETFTRVVRKLQKLDHEQLHDVYKNVDSICDGSPKAKKFMLDALSMMGSEAGVAMMTDLILKNEVTETDARTWFLMLGFMPKPTRPMIATLTALLQPSVSDKHLKAVLGISALINSYCKKNADCGSQSEVVDFVNRLANNLGTKCLTSTDKEKQKTIITLKALGNVGHFDGVVTVVQQCYQSANNPIDVRLAAIDAFRRLPCTNERANLLQEFFDQQEDSEVRIASYLASMVCPTSAVLAQVHKSLYNEEVNQVGSFVWTHLTNLNERSHYEHKYDVQKIVSSKKLREKFSTDFRKFSRYYETDAYLDALRTGFRADSTVVFSPKSYLPRSANLGLQLQLFGETVDLFVIGGRAEGFEALVESLFGQNGYFHDETIQKMLESARQQKPYSETKMNEISRIFNMKNAKDADPMGAFYMRIFGNDLHYFQFHGLDSMLGTVDTPSVMDTIFKLTQEEETTYTKNVLFMDSSLVVPTSIGFPLNLTVTGAASVNLKVGGKIDLSRLASNSLDAAVHLQPSAAIKISGTMMVEGVFSRSGLKIATTMHTSTYSNFEISVDNGEVIHARINVPKNQQDIFDIQSKVMIQDDDTERVHKPLVTESMEIERCSGGAITTYLGVELCGQLQYPLITANSETAAPAWILAGPYVTRLYLRKTDTTIKTYDFEYRWNKQVIQPDNGLAIRTGRLSFDTLGSSTDRKLMAEFVHNESEKSVSVSLIAPTKKISLHGKIVDDTNRKSLYTNWIVDGIEIVNLKTDLSIGAANDVGGGLQLTPSVLLDFYGRPVLALKGHFVKQEGKKYSAEVTVEHLTTYPITVSGAFSSTGSNSNQNYIADAAMDTGYLKSAAKAWIQGGNSNMALKGMLSYNFRNGQTNSATLSAKYDSTADAKGGRTWQANADFRSAAYPHYNWGLNATGQLGGGSFGQAEGALTFTYGSDDETRDIQKLSVQHKHDFQIGPEVSRSMSITKVAFPPANIDASLEFHNEISSNAIDAELTVQYEKNKKFNLIMTGSRGEQDMLLHGLAKLTTASGNTMKLGGDLTLTPDMEYTAKLTGNWKNDGPDVTAILKLKPRPDAKSPFDRQLTAELLFPDQVPLTLTADVQFNDQHKGIQAEAEMAKQKYKTYAEYHRPSLTNVQIVLGAHTPDKSYTGSVHLDNGQNDKLFKTELQLQDSPKLSSTMRFKRDDHVTKMSAFLSRGPDAYSVGLDFKTYGSEGRIVASSPKRNLGFSWNETGSVGQDDGQVMRGVYELWWHEDKKIVADVMVSGRLKPDERRLKAEIQVRTPFHGIEELGLRVGHTDDSRSWNTVAVAMLSGESIGALSSEGRVSLTDESTRVQANLRVETPFPTMPTFGLDLNYTCTGQNFESDINVSWYPEKQMELRIHGSASSGILNAAVEVKTPFEALHDASVSGDFVHREKLTGRLRLARNDDQIDVAVEGNAHFGMDKIESYLKMDATTPFAGWNKPSLMLSLNLNKSSATTGASFAWTPDKKVTVELQASRDSNEDVAVTVQVTTPFDSVRDVKLTAQHGHDKSQSGTNYRTGVDLSYNGEKFHVHLDWTPPSWKRSNMALVIGEPYGVFRRLAFQGHHLMSDNELDFGVKANWQDDKTAGVISKFESTESSLTGNVEIQLPLESCRNIRVKFDNKRDAGQRACQTEIDVDIDEHHVKAEHVITYENLLNFENVVHVRLPLRHFSELKLKTTQRNYELKLQHETNLIIDDAEYSIEATSDFTGDPLVTLKIDSPQWYLIIIGSHDIQNSLTKLDVELPPEQKYEMTVKHNFRKAGSGSVNVALITPVDSWRELSAGFDFVDRTGSAQVQWRPNRAVEVRWKLQDIKDLEVCVETPFSGYENSSIKAEVDSITSGLTANILATVHNSNYRIAVKGHHESNFAHVEVLLETPFSGFEELNFGGQYDFRLASVQLVSLKFGTFEAAVFRRSTNQVTDAGIAVSTPFRGYEYVKLSVHQDTYNNTIAVKLQKPDFKAEATVGATSEPEVAFLKLALASPSIKKFNVEGQYRSANDARSVDVAMTHDGRTGRLSLAVTGSHQKRKAAVQVTWPAANLTMYGQYDVTKSPVKAQLTISDGVGGHATVDVTANAGVESGKGDFLLVATSSLPSFRDIKVAGDYKSTPEATVAHVSIGKDGQKSCELDVTTSLSRRNRGLFRLALKTPFAGYEQSEFSVDADFETADRKSLSVSGRREDQSFAIEANVQFDGRRRLRRISIGVNSSVPNYEHLSGSLQMDDRNGKSTYLATFTRRPEVTYQLKLDVDAVVDVPNRHLQLSLLLKTPVEDFLLYGRFAVSSSGAVSLNLKSVSANRMSEFSLKFWQDANWRKLDANVMFNTNYQTMIASALGVSYDLFASNGERAEFALQSDYNGVRNAVGGKLAFAKNGDGKTTLLDVGVDGDVQSVPAIGKFSSSGTLDYAGGSGLRLAVKHNDKHHAEVTGNYVRNATNIEGTLALATSVAGYESTVATARLTTKHAKTKLTASLQSNGNSLLDVAGTLTRTSGKSDAGLDADVVFTSTMPNWQSTGRLHLTVESAGQKVALTGKLNDRNVFGNYEFDGDENSGKLRASWSADADRGKTNVAIDYDLPRDVRFSLTSNDMMTFTVDFRLPNARNDVTDGEQPGNANSTGLGLLMAQLVYRDRKLFTLDYQFSVLLNRLSVMAGDELLELLYDLRHDLKKFSADYHREGTRRFSVGAFLDVANMQRREAKFILKTPVAGFEDVRYETTYDVQKSELTALLQWQPDRAIAFEFGLDPDRSKLTAKMTTPFDGFENMDFVAYKSSDDSSASRFASMRFEWQDKKMELTARCEPNVKELSLSSPFEGFKQMTARVSYVNDPSTSASLRLSINDKTFDFVAKMDATAKSAHLEARTTVRGFELYAIEGTYDIQVGHGRLLLKCRDRRIDANVDLKSVNNGHDLTATLETTFAGLRKFGLTMGHGREGTECTGHAQVTINDCDYEASGRLALEADSLRAGLLLNSTSTTAFSVDVATQWTLDKYQLQVGVNKKEIEFHALLERPQDALNGLVRLSSMVGNSRLVPDFSVHVKYDARQPKASLTVHWNDLNTVQSCLEITTDGDLKFEFNSQVRPLGHAHAHVHFHPDSRQSTLKAMLDVEGFVKATLDVDSNHSLPHSLDAAARLTTSIHGFRESSAAISFVRSDDYGGSMRANVLLRTPLKFLKLTQLILSTENEDDQTRAAKLKFSFDNVENVVKVSWNQKTRNGVRGTLLVESPLIAYLAAMYQPNFKPRFQVTVAIRPGYYLIETTIVTTRRDPLTLLGKYVSESDGRKELVLELAMLELKHELHWQHDAYSGQLNITMPDYRHANHQTLSVDYSLMTRPTARNPFYSLSLRSNLAGPLKCRSSLAVTLHENLRKFNVDLQATSGQNGDRHSLVAGYGLDKDSFKSHLIIDCRFLPSRTVQMDTKIDGQNANIMVGIGSLRNVVKASYIKATTPTGTYDVQVSLDLPSLSIESTRLKGQVTVDDDQKTVHGQLMVQHQQYTALGSYDHSDGVSNADLKAGPLSISGRFSREKGYRRGETRLVVSGLGGPHKRAIDVDWDLDHGRAKLAYLVNDAKVFGLEGSLVWMQDEDTVVDGQISVHHGGVNHSIQVGWTRGRLATTAVSNADYRFLVRTPLMGINTLGLRSRLARIHGKHFEGFMTMDLPQSSHSFGAKFDRDPRTVQFEGMANSPYVTSRAYTLTGMASRESGKSVVTFTLANPTESHTARFETTRNEDGTAVLQASLNTPFLNINEVTVTCSIRKLDRTELDLAFQVTTSEASHVLKTRMAKAKNSLGVHLEWDTPLLMPSHSELDASVDFANAARLTFDVKALVVGKPFFLTGEVHRKAPDLKIKGRLKAGNEDNGFEIHLRQEAGTFSGSMQIEGDRVPSKKFQITGFYRMTTPDSVEGGLAFATPDKHFKVETNYRPRSKRSIDGLVEYRAAANDHSDPDLGMYLDYHGPQTATFRLRTSMEDYSDLQLSYNVERKMDGTAMLNITFSNGRVVYGLDSQILQRPSAIRKGHFVLIWSNERYSIGGEVHQEPGSLFEATFHVDLPIEGLRGIDYKTVLTRGPAKRSFSSVLSGTHLQHDIIGEINRKEDDEGSHGQLGVDLPIAGLRDVSLMFNFTQGGGEWCLTLEQTAGGQPIIQVDTLAVYRHGGIGNGKIHVSSLLPGLRNADLYYSFKEKNGKDAVFRANVGLNHNGKNLIEMDIKSKDGTTKWDIHRLTRPISIEYTYKMVEARTMIVAGTYCWNTESPQDSSVGFNARVQRQNTGLQATLTTVHPTRPVRIEFLSDRTDDRIKRDVEFSWGGPAEAVSYSIEANRNLVKIGLGFPTRKIRVFLQRDSEASSGQHSTSVSLEWDAGRDETKRIGFNVKWQDMSKADARLEHYYELGLSHPKLEKDLTISGRFVLDPTSERLAMARVELDYSKDENQKLTAEIRLDKTGGSTGMGYILKWSVQHLASDLSIATMAVVRDDVDVSSGWLHITYLGNGGQTKALQLGCQILKPLNKIQAQIEAPEMKLHFVGWLSTNHNGYSVHLESRLNDQEIPYSADLQLDRKDRHMAALKVIYNPDKKSTMMMRSGMLNKKTISFEILRTDNGKTIEDVKFSLNLNESRELVTRFHWRPQSLQEIQDLLPQLMQGLCFKTREIGANVNEYLANDLRIKYDRFTTSFSRSLSPMMTDLNQEIVSVVTDLHRMNMAFAKLYQNNVFYVRTIYDFVAPLKIGERLGDVANGVIRMLTDITYGFMHSLYNVAESIRRLCQMACENLVSAVASRISDVPYAVLHHISTLHELSVWTVHQLTMQTVRIIGDMLVYIAEAVHRWNGITPEWIHQVSVETTAKLQAYLDTFFASKYYVQLKSLVHEVVEAVQNVCNQEFCRRAYNLIKDQFLNLMDTLTSNTYCQRAREMAKTAYKIGAWAYDFLDIEGLARQLLQMFMVRMEHVALNTIEKIVLPDVSRDVVFAPEEGKLEIRQRLPLPWTSFDELPQVQGSPEYLRYEQLRENFGHLPAAALKNFKQALSEEFMGQSGDFKFRARALLVGDRHYVTFDGRAYEFAGQCSYLLAKDFVDDKFTVIVNYDRSRAVKKSLLMVVDGHRIEIASRTTIVLIDDVPIATPATVGSTHITRSGNSLSVASDVRQVWLTYDASHDFAVLEIGGFYHGKTGGLFGSYDHEPYNDHQLPDQSMDIDFAKAWEVGRDACPSYENQAQTEGSENLGSSYEGQIPCDELFGQFASLRSCFKPINPSPYKNMCLNDVSHSKGPCSVAAAYVAMCRARGIQVTIPKSCLECNVNGATVAQDEETVVEGSNIKRTADVVFVVDNTWQCSTTFANMRTTLATVARNVEGALQAARVQDNQYGVVGYGGGAENRPQAFTIDGQTFVAVSELDRSLDNIQFTSGRHHHLSNLIEYAATEVHGYRPTSKKVFVVVPCAEETDETDAVADRIRKHLIDTDATVHVISIREPVVREDSKINLANIIGYDSRTAFTLKSAQRGQLLGDDKTRRLMVIQDTALVKMAFATNGSVFYASRLGSVQPSVSRLANEAFARRIASKAIPATCQNCQCTVTAGSGMPVAICSKCSSDAVQEVTFGDEGNQEKWTSSKDQTGKKITVRKQSRKKALDEKTRYHKF